MPFSRILSFMIDLIISYCLERLYAYVDERLCFYATILRVQSIVNLDIDVINIIL